MIGHVLRQEEDMYQLDNIADERNSPSTQARVTNQMILSGN
jgi:hypothetical protein